MTRGFFTKLNPKTVEWIKCTVGHFILLKIFRMIRNWLLTFGSMNTLIHLTGLKISFAFEVGEFLELFCSVLRLFQVWLPFRLILPGMVIVECYLVQHCVVNWSRELEVLIVWEQLLSFDPCHYSLPLIQIVNKLITNSETWRMVLTTEWHRQWNARQTT